MSAGITVMPWNAWTDRNALMTRMLGMIGMHGRTEISGMPGMLEPL